MHGDNTCISTLNGKWETGGKLQHFIFYFRIGAKLEAVSASALKWGGQGFHKVISFES